MMNHARYGDRLCQNYKEKGQLYAHPGKGNGAGMPCQQKPTEVQQPLVGSTNKLIHLQIS